MTPKKIRILIVEDVPEMAESLKLALQSELRFHVTGVAHNLWEARTVNLRNRPNYVLLDEILPGESALDYVQELLNDEIRVILMTGILNPTHAIAPGVLGRLIKPDLTGSDSDLNRFLSEINKLTG